VIQPALQINLFHTLGFTISSFIYSAERYQEVNGSWQFLCNCQISQTPSLENLVLQTSVSHKKKIFFSLLDPTEVQERNHATKMYISIFCKTFSSD